MKRILLTSPSALELGGLQAFLLNWVSITGNEKISYIWYLPRGVNDSDYAQKFENLHVQLYARNHVLNQSKIALAFRAAKDLTKMLKSDIDIVHINTGSTLYAALVSLISKIHKMPIIIAHSHSSGASMKGSLSKIANPLLRFIINHCVTKKVACSVLAAEALFGKKNAKDAIIIPNCIDAKRFAFSEENRKDIRKQYGLEGCFVIGQVARLSPEKNQKFILDILKEFLKNDISTRVLLVGDGPIKNELMEYAAQLDIDKFVIFAGSSKTPEMFYSAMDIFLLPSIYEGFGIVNIEAQASGLYCVVSKNVPSEVNITGHMNFLPLSSSAKEWADEIIRVKNNVSDNREASYQVISKSKYDLSALEQYISNLYN